MDVGSETGGVRVRVSAGPDCWEIGRAALLQMAGGLRVQRFEISPAWELQELKVERWECAARGRGDG